MNASFIATLVLALAASATAFAPAVGMARTATRASAWGQFADDNTAAERVYNMEQGIEAGTDIFEGTSAEGLYGVCKPFSNGFDPLGLAAKFDRSTMLRCREAEIKHGRVSMLAVLGFFVSEEFHPIEDLVDNGIPVPADFASQATWETPAERPLLIAFLISVGVAEATSIRKTWDMSFENRGKIKEDVTLGGYLPYGPWAPGKQSPEKFEKKQLAELNNGRLAMIAIAGIVAQEYVSRTFIDAELISGFSGGM